MRTYPERASPKDSVVAPKLLKLYGRGGSIEQCPCYLILVKELSYGETERPGFSLEEVSRLVNAYRAAIVTSSSNS